ncbi:hypothetical protein YPPY58_1248, partial [Yersinia pestis PY-58]
MLACQYP